MSAPSWQGYTQNRDSYHAPVAVCYAANPSEPMNRLFFLLTLVAYVGSFVAYIGYLVAGRDWSARIGSILLAGCLVAHYFALLERPRRLPPVPYPHLSRSVAP